jgi:rhodanese-related sulfurtransferase
MVETLKPEAAAQLLSSSPSIDVIDVRDEREWCTGHLPNARLVPLETFRADPEKAVARDHAVLFVCAKGVRSLSAAKLAERLGYQRIYSLDGGTKEWAKAGLPLITGSGDALATAA